MMWPFNTFKTNIIAITCEPKAITLSWILSTQNKNKPPLMLNAYEKINCNYLEVEQLIVFNPTRIKKYIDIFAKKHHITRPSLCIAVQGSQCHEQLIYHDKPSASLTTLGLSNHKQLQWQYRFLYPTDDHRFTFYAAGLPYYVITQYNLLARSMGLNFQTLTTYTMAMLCLYKYMYGTTFRHAQLGIHLKQSKHSIERLFSPDLLARIITIPTTLVENKNENLSYLLAACGMFLTESTGE